MNSQIAKSVIERIKKEHIANRPKWHFLLKNYAFWVLFFLFIIMGGLSLSVIIFEITEIESELFAKLPWSDIIIFVLPLLWMFLLGGFLILAILGIKNTKKGYKYNPLGILAISILLSFILGFIIFYFDGGEKTERIFTEHIGIFPGRHEKNRMIFSNPQMRLLGGKIININDAEQTLTLNDFNNHHWQVDCANISPKAKIFLEIKKNDPQAFGELIKIIGKKISDHQFTAEEIRPWMKNHSNNGIPKFMHQSDIESLTPKNNPELCDNKF